MGVNISPAFVLFWTALYFFGGGGLFRAVALSVAVHELCHLAAIRLTGGRVSGLELRLNGFIIVTDGLTSYRRELICAAVGPVGSAVLAIIAAKSGLYTLSGASGSLFAFNVLPVLPLDGGRALYCAVADCWGVSAAEKVLLVSSIVVIAALMAMWVLTGTWIFVYFAGILYFSCCQISRYGVQLRM